MFKSPGNFIIYPMLEGEMENKKIKLTCRTERMSILLDFGANFPHQETCEV